MKRTKPRQNPLWRHPPGIHLPGFEPLSTPERFPGKGFAMKGARWLQAGRATNLSIEQRRECARLCFQRALRACDKAVVRAKAKGQKERANHLAEISQYLENWLKSI